MVSRKWIETPGFGRGDASRATAIFEYALEREGLLGLLTDERIDLDPDDPRRPILLAVSDNVTPMTADAPALSWSSASTTTALA